jgi:hypothetical protein
MKFRKSVIFFIFIAMVIAYFTKPTKQDFLDYIRPSISETDILPVVDFRDNFLYVTITATYVDTLNSTKQNGRTIAAGFKEAYIGAFKKFWKTNQ